MTVLLWPCLSKWWTMRKSNATTGKHWQIPSDPMSSSVEGKKKTRRRQEEEWASIVMEEREYVWPHLCSTVLALTSFFSPLQHNWCHVRIPPSTPFFFLRVNDETTEKHVMKKEWANRVNQTMCKSSLAKFYISNACDSKLKKECVSAPTWIITKGLDSSLLTFFKV